MKNIIYNYLVTFALTIAGKKELKVLQNAATNCKATEYKTLRQILQYAKNTQWGKAHNFATILKAKTLDELYTLYKENNPIVDYEDIRPIIDRQKEGEENLLHPGLPIMYAMTSGTTAQPKWIPITKTYCNKVYKKMSRLWLYTFIIHRPKVFFGKCLSIVGKTIEGYATCGTVCGNVSGLTRDDCPKFIRKIHSSPSIVFGIADYKARYYVLMRTAIEQDVTCLITANPSTVVEMQNNVNEFFEDYIKDIENGTLNKDLNIEPEIREKLEKLYKPNPKRANQLRTLKGKYHTVLPRNYWPNFQALTTWKCGNTAVYLNKFSQSFPSNTLHQEFGYFASECRFGLVLNGKDDTVPFVHFHFFEFTPANEIGQDTQHYLQLHELEVGKRYCVYITTFSGLYRYKMNDIVECTNMYDTIPTLQFIQKTAGIISITGEKLHERQFIEAVENACKKTSIMLNFYIGFADILNSVYHFYFELKNASDIEKANELCLQVDLQLKSLNIEYKAKRDSLRLKQPKFHILQENSFELYKQKCLKDGARDGQFKLNLLMQDEKKHTAFKALIRK